MNEEMLDRIRVRVMQTAYDLADDGNTEGYNAVKVLCHDLLGMLKAQLPDDKPKPVPLTLEQITQTLGVEYGDLWDWNVTKLLECVRKIEAAHGIGEKK